MPADTMHERHLQRAREFVGSLKQPGGYNLIISPDTLAGKLLDAFEEVEGEVAAANVDAIARVTTQRDRALAVIADIQDAIADPDIDRESKLMGIAHAVRPPKEP